jgi:colicin import membrane protein
MAKDRPREPARLTGRWLALALAVAVHVAFIAVLVVSVRWQNRPPSPVTAELYAPTPKLDVADEPAPAPPLPPPVPKQEQKPEPKPEAPPPKAVPKPEPKTEKPDPHAAEIARKARQEEERKRQEQIERDQRERAKQEAEKREADRQKAEAQKQLAEARERQAREAQELKAQAEREKTVRDAQQKAAEADAAARTRAEADYIRRIQTKVKGNVVLPPDLGGNPEAVFEVVQLPTGEIIDAVLKKSSGIRAYDEAVQRAIVKSSPLPRPERPELFQRVLTLKFRPLD